MRIGELAERIGVSPRSLRYYEQQGLLSPSRAANGYREYDQLALIRSKIVPVAPTGKRASARMRPRTCMVFYEGAGS